MWTPMLLVRPPMGQLTVATQARRDKALSHVPAPLRCPVRPIGSLTTLFNPTALMQTLLKRQANLDHRGHDMKAVQGSCMQATSHTFQTASTSPWLPLLPGSPQPHKSR